jgi:hypothetical protein
MANTIDRQKTGRKPGTPNKVTKGIKDNILDVFDRIGGVQNFAAWAQENQTEFYRHYAKLLPTEINANLTATVIIQASKLDERI